MHSDTHTHWRYDHRQKVSRTLKIPPEISSVTLITYPKSYSHKPILFLLSLPIFYAPPFAPITSISISAGGTQPLVTNSPGIQIQGGMCHVQPTNF